MTDVVCAERSRYGTARAGGHGDDNPDDGDSDDDIPRQDESPDQHNPARPSHGGGGMGNDGDDDPGDGGGDGPPLQEAPDDSPFLSSRNPFPTSAYNTHNFEKYMKQEVSLTTLTRPHVYLFYNKLRHLSAK